MTIGKQFKVVKHVQIHFNYRYFVDEAVLNRVPYLFLLLGTCFAALQLPAIFLVKIPSSDDVKELKDLREPSELDEDNHYQVQPKNVVKIVQFWQLWLIMLSLSIFNNFITNYKKAFGQTVIQDDVFFARAAVFQSAINGIGRFAWGWVYDKLGFKARMS
jgi:hypothetical protein